MFQRLRLYLELSGKWLSLSDNPELPTITFRYFVLSAVFVIPGAFLSQMIRLHIQSFLSRSRRTMPATTSLGFSQAVLSGFPAYLGSFSMNSGPWNIEEHALITVTDASCATYNLGYTPIVLAELYYGERMNPAVAIFLMFSIVRIGYAFAALTRQLLLHDPEYVWPQALMQTTLFETFRRTDISSSLARRQMKVFFLSLLGMILWQFLLEYVFPLTSSLAFLGWVAPRNKIANFIGSGLGRMGFLNLSLDWSNINWNGSSIRLTPW